MPFSTKTNSPLPAFDCKAVRPRSRPGSKKKTLPLPQTPEEMYRLTCRYSSETLLMRKKMRKFLVANTHVTQMGDCLVYFVILICSPRLRFCDLVFQGPLSVQEDWIKHLQRHIMNTSVPHTGLGMIEVASPPTTIKTEQDSSPTATHAAS